MQIQIIGRTRDIDEGTRRFVHDRVAHSFHRFSHWIRRIVVRLDDVSGPRGGADKAVAVHLHGHGGGLSRLEVRADSYEGGVVRALRRARRAVLGSRQYGGRRPRRGTPLMGAPS